MTVRTSHHVPSWHLCYSHEGVIDRRLPQALAMHAAAALALPYVKPKPAPRSLAALYYNHARAAMQIRLFVEAIDRFSAAADAWPDAEGVHYKSIQQRAECRMQLTDYEQVGSSRVYSDSGVWLLWRPWAGGRVGCSSALQSSSQQSVCLQPS